MARGRGRGRGVGRKTPIMNDGSSIGTCVEALGLQEQEQAQKGQASFEAEVARSTKVARRLSLDSLRTNEEVLGNSDLEGFEDERKVDGIGTVTRSLEEKLNGENGNRNAGTEQEQKKEANEPCVNMFKNNRVASNGMQLSYFPPQIVNGQTMVQLEGKEVQEEEQKWKCALIAYVIGECPR